MKFVKSLLIAAAGVGARKMPESMRLKETKLDGCPCADQKLCEPIQEWPE
jgi:hypothetical protein